MGKKQQKGNNGPGTVFFSVTLGFFLFMTIYTLSMLLAIAPSNPKLAMDGMIAFGILPLITAILLYKQIRYWIATGTGPDVKGKWAALRSWFHRFLFPVRTGFRPVTEPTRNEQKMAARFRDSLSGFYEDNRDPDQVTQMYGNLLRLHRERLNDLGLSVHTSYQAMSVRNLDEVAVPRIPDGKLEHYSIQEYLKSKKTILCGNREVYTNKKNTKAVCDVVGAKNGGGEASGAKLICPNCGAVSTMTELVGGCPFCGTAFLMEDLANRVCSFSTAPSPEMDETYFHLRLNQIINRAAFGFAVIEIIFGFIPLFYDAFIVQKASAAELPFTIVLITSSTLLLFFSCILFNWVITLPIRAAGHYIYKKRREKLSLDHQVMERNRRILPQICKKDPSFSMESFFSNVRNKIAAIHYSGKHGQADVFSQADVSTAVQQYKDVAECIWGPMELLEYQLDGMYKTASVDTWLTLLHWDGTQICTTTEKLHLRLQRLREESRENPFGIHVPTCSKCGASVDLMLGNVCPHCGSELNFMKLDWCITDYGIEEQ